MPWLANWWSSSKPDSSAEKTSDPRKESITSISSSTPSQTPTATATPTLRDQEQHASNTSPSTLLAPFLTPQTLLATAILTTLTVTTLRLYKTYLHRIPDAPSIPQSYFHLNPRTSRPRSVFGRVTSVGDGDNFRLYHTPGGRLAGWDWLPWKTIPTDRKELRGQTIHVRLAGVDAPEASHFGRPAQPHSAESLEWLNSYLMGRRVRAYVYRADQYGRVVATAYTRRWGIRRDVGLEMLRCGMAGVYEAKTGVEFGGEGMEKVYRAAEEVARRKGRGMWSGGSGVFESPREYKRKYASGSGSNLDDSEGAAKKK